MVIDLSNDNIYSGDLILVNKDYSYHSKFVTKDLIKVNEKILLENRVKCQLEKVLDKIDGYRSIAVTSGWRAMKEQADLYAQSLEKRGALFTKKYVALPNHSEHQTGLAIDVGLSKRDIDYLCPEFPYEGICQKFREEAVQYGFIERYPKNKENITGIAHEPWHFRYIGVPHAEIMKRHDLCLEEYIEFVKQYPYGKGNYSVFKGDYKIAVSYLSAEEKEK